MSRRKNIIKKIAITLVSLAMIACFILLFVAASKDRSKSVCKSIDIAVNNNTDKIFIDRKDITNAIVKDSLLNPIGRPLNTVELQQIEQVIKKYPWVKDAELYVDNHDILQINITQRTPLARIFTSDGQSFYIDREIKHLPITGSFAIKLPVFTGLKNDAATSTPKDSVLYSQIVALSDYLAQHPFWMAQIDQVNINSRNEFEFVPTVGNALIEFGKANNIDEKFNKLLAFYQNGLNNIGWGYYDTLSLQYDGQVVATRKNNKGVPVIDSLLTSDGYNIPENKLK